MHHPRPLLFLTLLFTASAASAVDCSPIKKDNNRNTQRLNQQKAQLELLQANIIRLNTSCQTLQIKVSAQMSAAATGESCHALRENARLNKELTKMSTQCSTEMEQSKANVNVLTTQYVQPMEEALDFITDVDKSLPLLTSLCPNEIAMTRQMEDFSKTLLAQSKATILKAGTDATKYAGLAEKTSQFQQVTQGGADRCVVDAAVAGGNTKKLGVSATQGVSGGKKTDPAFSGTDRVPASDISGADAARRKAAESQRIINQQKKK